MTKSTPSLTDSSVPSGFCRAEGIIRNYNTIEEYRSADKAAHIERAGRIVSQVGHWIGPIDLHA